MLFTLLLPLKVYASYTNGWWLNSTTDDSYNPSISWLAEILNIVLGEGSWNLQQLGKYFNIAQPLLAFPLNTSSNTWLKFHPIQRCQCWGFEVQLSWVPVDIKFHNLRLLRSTCAQLFVCALSKCKYMKALNESWTEDTIIVYNNRATSPRLYELM